MRPLGDRRSCPRLEVVGTLWGCLEDGRSVRFLNLSRNGALIVSSVPFAVDSVQMIQLTIEGQTIRLKARVRHLVAVDEADAARKDYGVGLELLEAPSALAAAIVGPPRYLRARYSREKSSDS